MIDQDIYIVYIRLLTFAGVVLQLAYLNLIWLLPLCLCHVACSLCSTFLLAPGLSLSEVLLPQHQPPVLALQLALEVIDPLSLGVMEIKPPRRLQVVLPAAEWEQHKRRGLISIICLAT